MFEGDGSSVFLGDEASFQKKEVELAKKLVSMEIQKSLIMLLAYIHIYMFVLELANSCMLRGSCNDMNG